ncbi:hypothetical protein [Pectobacterium parmentieri]|uniref:hypothetical protein n=1 Tax=Pectobacterium parmentieri TaxID=1905730 RepID=UPI0018E0E9BF|nr:hypothetical protein [Pectobacterium parmentieri]QQA76660.1 hypothetical protein JBL47_03305 [Pectobacterium parmentieri]
MENESVRLEREEVNALIKLILYVKFECEDLGSTMYSSSPIINSIFEKVLNMYGYKEDWDNVFVKIPEVKKSFVFNKIEILESQQGHCFEEETKKIILDNHLYPYKI